MRFQNFLSTVVSVILLTLSIPFLSAQVVQHVDAAGLCGGNAPCFTTISAAVTAAAANDTILVYDGIYNENVIVNKALVILSVNGSGAVTVNGANVGAALATFHIINTGGNVTLGLPGQGFTINGYDTPAPGLEESAIYVNGTNGDVTIQDNIINANGEAGLLWETGSTNGNVDVSFNTFGGQTFVGDPAECGFANQFTVHNVPRQLVVFNPATYGTLEIGENTFTGVTGGFNPAGGCEQGNWSMTVDAGNAMVHHNIFNGTTTRFAGSLRTRGTGTSVFCNTFMNANLASPTVTHMFFNPVIFAGASPANVTELMMMNIFDDYGAHSSNFPTNILKDPLQAAAAGGTITLGNVQPLPACASMPDTPTITCPADLTVDIMSMSTCDTSIYYDVMAEDASSDTVMGFTGILSFVQWAQRTSGGGTPTYTDNTPTDVSIEGAAGGFPFGAPSTADFCYTFTCAGPLSLDWTATKSGASPTFIGDHAYIGVNGVFTQLTPGGFGVVPANGTINMNVAAGDEICFRVESNRIGTTTILNLSNIRYSNLLIEQISGPMGASAPGMNDGAPLTPGTHQIEMRAVNCFGLADTCSFELTVNDPPPTITCPMDITINLDTFDCSRVLCYQVTGMDNCPNTSLNVPGFQSLGTFNNNSYFISAPGFANHLTWEEANLIAAQLGGHLVVIESQAENDFLTASIPFEAGILDNQYWIGLRYSPMLGDFKWTNGAAFSYSNWGFGQPGIIDGPYVWFLDLFNLGTWFDSPSIFGRRYIIEFEQGLQIKLISGIPSGSPFPPGTTTNVYQAMDAFGQTATCSFDVTVIGSTTMACKDLNVSLDSSCMALITPRMVLVGEYNCYDVFEVTLSHYNQPVPNPVTADWIGKHITATVTDPTTGNSCWSTLLIEDKLAPIIACANDTMNCVEYNGHFPSLYTIMDCSEYTVRLLDERVEKVDCNDSIVKRIYLTWATEDASGLRDTCQQLVVLRRVSLDSIEWPNFLDTIYCDTGYRLGENGLPHPYESGVPTLLGDSLWPNKDFLCNIYTDYEDEFLGKISCVSKIRRTWTVREWWCGQELERFFVQYVIIVDTAGPAIVSTPHFYGEYTTSNRECYAYVDAPPIGVQDACHAIHRVDIAYPGGVLIGQNGGVMKLPVGWNDIVYTAYDSCYNSTVWQTRVLVKDGTQPVVVCERNTVVSVTYSGEAWVRAEVFDDGSFDECGPVKLDVRRMDENSCGTIGPDDWGEEVGFCCADIGTIVMVALRATDHSGNTNICMISVEVQDKIPPTIVCPPDITVDCRIDWDENHLDIFGRMVEDPADAQDIVIDPRYNPVFGGPAKDGYIYDNCPPVMQSRINVDNISNCGLGTLWRIFFTRDQAGNETVLCTQRITFTNNQPITGDSIVWPLDFDTTGCVPTSALDPEDLYDPYSYPRWRDDECRLIGSSYEDEILNTTGQGEPCYKIRRHWKVIDWCSRTSGGTFPVWEYDQYLKVYNTEDPEITLCRDTTICVYTADCDPVQVSIPVSGRDDCTPEAELLWKYKIDFDSDGTIDVEKQGVNLTTATGVYPIGSHTIKWEVEDRCGNTAKCERTLEIRNCKTPTAYCLHGLSIGLVPMDTNGDGVPDTEMDTVWASDLDAGSGHVCTNYYVTLSFSSDTADKFRIYDCDSLGVRNVELWVTDQNGNQSFCRTFIDVQDNNNVNICAPRLTGGIAGEVRSEQGDKVQEVLVRIDQTPQERVTDYEGEYDFGQMAAGGQYEVVPSRTDGWLNGVTTADILSIQKHILGIRELQSAYQHIAADVNKSKTISAADVSLLRKLILGKISEVQQNTSWRFVDATYSFVDPQSAESEAFPEKYPIVRLQREMEIDWIGVKIGDVSGDAKTRGLTNPGGKVRTGAGLELVLEPGEERSGGEIEYILSAKNLGDFDGVQFTLNWEATELELIEVQGIDRRAYNADEKAAGRLMVAWTREGQTDREARELMRVRFVVKVVKGIEELSQMLRLTSEVTVALSVDGQGVEQSVTLRGLDRGISELIVLDNEPNPWNTSTMIGYILPQETVVTKKIYDAQGKVHLVEQGVESGGYHEWRVEGSELEPSGVYYYQISTESSTITKRMLLID